MSTQTLSFDSATELSFDTALVEVASSTVRLKDLGGATYSTANPAVNSQHAVLMSSFLGISASETKPAGSEIKYQLLVDGVAYYYNTTTLLWAAASSSSYSQANTITELAAYTSLVADLSLSGSFYLGVRVFLHSDSGSARPALTSFTVQSRLAYLSPSSISECAISANLINLLGEAYDPGSATPAKLCVKNGRSFMHGNKVVLPFEKTATVDASGNVSLQVIETESVAEALEFSIQYYENSSLRVIRLIPAIVPNAPTRTLDQVTSVEIDCWN